MTASTPPLRILLVEDHDPVRRLTADFLQHLGHNVVAVPSAEEALVAIGEASFDVLVTDHGLPGMSGVEFAAIVVQRHPHTRIVLATGYGDAVPGTDRLGTPPIVLTKPYMADDLEALVHRLVDERG